MEFEPVEGLPPLHETPLGVVKIASPSVFVDVDDEGENRVRLIFCTYQAVRMTTTDCYLPPAGLSVIPRTVVRVLGSAWVADLRRKLRKTDILADFLEKSQHYLVPLQDDFLEVVAWGVAVEDVDEE